MVQKGKWDGQGIVLFVVQWIQSIHYHFYELLQTYSNNNLYFDSRKTSMSQQKTVQEQPLNLREQYKLQKLQQLNQIYYCQCGKNYLTFSALYLHARNKHQVKLTTKRNSSNSKVEQKQEKTLITYFIRPQPTQTEQHIQSVKIQELQNQQQHNTIFSQIIEVITLYLRQDMQRHSNSAHYHNLVIEQFQNYFQLLQEQDITKYPVNANAITLYFNDFVCNYIPLAHSQKLISLHTLGTAETELIRFWRWLRENQYTSSDLFHRNYPSPSFGQ